MHEGAHTGSINCSGRTVGGDAGTRVTTAPQWSPHMFPHRSAGECMRHRSARLPPVATARRAIAACNVARYSESCGSGTRDCGRCTNATTRRGSPRSRATASAYPVPSPRVDASGQRRRARLPAASPQGRPRGTVERPRLGQLARGVPLRGRRGRGRGPDRLPLTEWEH